MSAGLQFPDLRTVLVHVLMETATHAGHLDAVRELLDGTPVHRCSRDIISPTARRRTSTGMAVMRTGRCGLAVDGAGEAGHAEPVADPVQSQMRVLPGLHRAMTQQALPTDSSRE